MATLEVLAEENKYLLLVVAKTSSKKIMSVPYSACSIELGHGIEMPKKRGE